MSTCQCPHGNSTLSVTLRKGNRGFGFTLSGEYPCRFGNVQPSGVAAIAGIANGDQLLAVGDIDVSQSAHREIVSLIADRDTLPLTVQGHRFCPKADVPAPSSRSSSVNSDRHTLRAPIFDPRGPKGPQMKASGLQSKEGAKLTITSTPQLGSKQSLNRLSPPETPIFRNGTEYKGAERHSNSSFEHGPTEGNVHALHHPNDERERRQGIPQADNCLTDGPSEIDSDSQVWRQQRLATESRIVAGSMKRNRKLEEKQRESSKSKFENLIRPYQLPRSTSTGPPCNEPRILSALHGPGGPEADFLQSNSHESRKVRRRPGHRKSESAGRLRKNSATRSGSDFSNLWQFYGEQRFVSGSAENNSLPSSLRSSHSQGSTRHSRQRSWKRQNSEGMRTNNGSLAPVEKRRNERQHRERKSRPLNRSLSEPDCSLHNASPSTSILAHAPASDSEHFESTDDDSEVAGGNRGCSTSTESSDEEAMEDEDYLDPNLVFQCVLVYIGAIPVPHLLLSKRHIIRGALASLKAQQAKARTVLLQVFTNEVIVTNSRGSMTHRFQATKIVWTAATNENKQFFGVCVAHSLPESNGAVEGNAENASDGLGIAVCHVFAADPQLHLHSFHYGYARKFGLRCTRDPDNSFCVEFPFISTPVIQSLSYILKLSRANHPDSDQPTSASPNRLAQGINRASPRMFQGNRGGGYVSSNSDSGIGGRDVEDLSPVEKAPSEPKGCILKKSPAKRRPPNTTSNLKVTFEEPFPTSLSGSTSSLSARTLSPQQELDYEPVIQELEADSPSPDAVISAMKKEVMGEKDSQTYKMPEAFDQGDTTPTLQRTQWKRNKRRLSGHRRMDLSLRRPESTSPRKENPEADLGHQHRQRDRYASHPRRYTSQSTGVQRTQTPSSDFPCTEPPSPRTHSSSVNAPVLRANRRLNSNGKASATSATTLRFHSNSLVDIDAIDAAARRNPTLSLAAPSVEVLMASRESLINQQSARSHSTSLRSEPIKNSPKLDRRYNRSYSRPLPTRQISKQSCVSSLGSHRESWDDPVSPSSSTCGELHAGDVDTISRERLDSNPFARNSGKTRASHVKSLKGLDSNYFRRAEAHWKDRTRSDSTQSTAKVPRNFWLDSYATLSRGRKKTKEEKVGMDSRNVRPSPHRGLLPRQATVDGAYKSTLEVRGNSLEFPSPDDLIRATSQQDIQSYSLSQSQWRGGQGHDGVGTEPPSLLRDPDFEKMGSADFELIIKDPQARKPFHDFLDHQFCGENLTFWIAVEKYRILPEKERAKIGKQLIENHFSPASADPVNVDAHAMHRIRDAGKTGEYRADLFDVAQHQIFHLMKFDCWPRFLKSEFAKKEASEASTSGAGADDKGSKRKSLLPWKGDSSWKEKLPSMMHRKKKEPTSSIGSSGKDENKKIGAEATASNVNPVSSTGSKKRQGWTKGRQASMPEEATHAVMAGVGSSVRKSQMSSNSAIAESGAATAPVSRTQQAPPPLIPRCDSATQRKAPPPAPGRRGASQDSSDGGVHMGGIVSPGPPLRKQLNPSSAPSIASLDSRCIVVLPDGQRVTVPIPENVNVRQWLQLFASKHGLNAAMTDVTDQNTGEILSANMHEDAQKVLTDRIIRLYSLILFRIDLPVSPSKADLPRKSSAPASEALRTTQDHVPGPSTSTAIPSSSSATDTTKQPPASTTQHRKLLAVRARAESAAGVVLKPVLRKYGLELDQLVICLSGTPEVLPSSAPIKRADNKKLLVLYQQEFQDWIHTTSSCPSTPVIRPRGCTSCSSSGSSTSGEYPAAFHEIAGAVRVAELRRSSNNLGKSENGSKAGGEGGNAKKRSATVESESGEQPFRKASASISGSKSEYLSKDEAANVASNSSASGMLKFVKQKSGTVSQDSLPSSTHNPLVASTSGQPQSINSPSRLDKWDQPQPSTLTSGRRTLGSSLKAKTFSAETGHSSAGTHGPVSPAGTLKRQTLANPQELRDQMKQDQALSQLLGRAQASRYDDQRGTAPLSYELPEFLKPKSSNSCLPTSGLPRGDAKSDEWHQKMDESDLLQGTDLTLTAEDLETSGLMPTASEAEALFSGKSMENPLSDGSSSGLNTSVDFSNPKMTEHKSMAEYGFSENSSSPAANVSIIAVEEIPTSTSRPSSRDSGSMDSFHTPVGGQSSNQSKDLQSSSSASTPSGPISSKEFPAAAIPSTDRIARPTTSTAASPLSSKNPPDNVTSRPKDPPPPYPGSLPRALCATSVEGRIRTPLLYCPSPFKETPISHRDDTGSGNGWGNVDYV